MKEAIVMTLFEFIICICCAVIFGFLIGLERQLTGHVAGIRTNILVSMGACLFTLFSQLMGAPDTTRIAAQVVTGIGFLCGGVIFKEGINVRGLNTAATIWCTAAIGVLCSSGFFLYATIATAVLLTSNLIFRFIANKIQPFTSFEKEINTHVRHLQNPKILRCFRSCDNHISIGARKKGDTKIKHMYTFSNNMLFGVHGYSNREQRMKRKTLFTLTLVFLIVTF
jgi:uncharacterized membrane protein YhiD involved in acid resistance